MLVLDLPWPPSVNNYWRSVNGRVLVSSAGRAYQKTVTALCARVPCREDRLLMLIHAHPPDRRRRDLDNILKATLDSLQVGRVYRDDSQIDDLRVVRREPVNGGRLRVHIEEIG